MDDPTTHPQRLRAEVLIFAGSTVLYALLAFLCHSDQLIWDEDRYLGGARNLTQGFFVPDDNPNFLNGPGYPLVLLPVVALNASLLWARMLNGLFVALAGVLVFRTVRWYASGGWAWTAALATVLHPNMIRLGPYLMTEPLTLFLVSITVWGWSRAFRSSDRSRLWSIFTAACFAWLILTRVFFGHVALAMLLGSLGAWFLIKPLRAAMRRSAGITLLALVFCLPYLHYTWKKTGQMMCWATTSGEVLYWITSHHPGESGHWFSDEDAMTKPELAPNHKAFYERLQGMRVLEREAAFKQAALENLRSAGVRQLATNWVCNMSRMFFGFPRSFRAEELSPLPIIAFNFPLLVLTGFAVILGLWRWRTVPVELGILLAMAVLYVGGSSIAPALPRYFVVIVPVLWAVTAGILHRRVRLTLIQE